MWYRKYKMMRAAGFTLVELLIVVAIIGLLASVAMPMYTDYVLRSRVAEAMVLGKHMQNIATEYYSSTGKFPNVGQMKSGIGNAVIEPDDTFTRYKLTNYWSYDCKGGYDNANCYQIQLWANTKLMKGFIGPVYGSKGRALISMKASMVNNNLRWTCGYDVNQIDITVNPKYLPSSCRTPISSDGYVPNATFP